MRRLPSQNLRVPHIGVPSFSEPALSSLLQIHLLSIFFLPSLISVLLPKPLHFLEQPLSSKWTVTLRELSQALLHHCGQERGDTGYKVEDRMEWTEDGRRHLTQGCNSCSGNSLCLHHKAQLLDESTSLAYIRLTFFRLAELWLFYAEVSFLLFSDPGLQEGLLWWLCSCREPAIPLLSLSPSAAGGWGRTRGGLVDILVSLNCFQVPCASAFILCSWTSGRLS